MTTMKEHFAKYEQAATLKQLGFDEPCFGGYYHNGENVNLWFFKPAKNSDRDERVREGFATAPLKQQVFKWFREKHDLQYRLNDGGYLGKCFIKITGYKHDKFYFSSSEPMDYEEAEDACIGKLIELVKEKQK